MQCSEFDSVPFRGKFYTWKTYRGGESGAEEAVRAPNSRWIQHLGVCPEPSPHSRSQNARLNAGSPHSIYLACLGFTDLGSVPLGLTSPREQAGSPRAPWPLV